MAWSPRVEHADVIALGSKVRYLYIIIAVCFFAQGGWASWTGLDIFWLGLAAMSLLIFGSSVGFHLLIHEYVWS